MITTIRRGIAHDMIRFMSSYYFLLGFTILIAVLVFYVRFREGILPLDLFDKIVSVRIFAVIDKS